MSSEPKLLSRIEYASFLVYNPNPKKFSSDVSALSRRVVDAVKRETAQWARKQRLGERMVGELGDAIRETFFPMGGTLVPMPGHAPFKDPAGSHWSARELCQHLACSGLASDWRPLLSRTEAVPKSAFCKPEDRPTVERHAETMTVSPELGVGEVITVVDDVITRGATMLAAVSLLAQAYPSATVRGFALIRSDTDCPIREVKSPVRGTVTVVPWGTKREP